MSTVLTPPTCPPPASWPSHILPPSPLLPAPPCHLVLFTQLRARGHAPPHTQTGIFSPHFLSQWKNRMKGLFQTLGYRGNFFILPLSNIATTGLYREWQNVGHLKFKGTKGTAVPLSAIVLPFCLLYTETLPLSFFSLSICLVVLKVKQLS